MSGKFQVLAALTLGVCFRYPLIAVWMYRRAAVFLLE
jgi:hypothetical protein